MGVHLMTFPSDIQVQSKEIECLKQRVKAWKSSGKKGQKLRRKLGITQGERSMEVSI